MADTPPSSEAFNYLFALNRLGAGDTLQEALEHLRRLDVAPGGPPISADKRAEVEAGVEWLVARFSRQTPVTVFADMSSREKGQNLLLPEVGTLVLAPAVEVQTNTTIDIEPQARRSGDLLLLRGWYYQSPATVFTGAVCHSSDPAAEILSAVSGEALLRDADSGPPPGSIAGGLVVLVRAARPGTARVVATFLRVNGDWFRVACEVTVSD